MNEMNYIAIDGILGVGKSTLSNMLNKKPFTLVEEPFNENPLLEKFYSDRKRYSFPSQIFFLNKKFEYMKKISKDKNIILDRSIYGDYTFAKTLMAIGDMSKEEFELYDELFHNMIQYIKHPDLLIFLDTSTKTTVNRINKRGRSFEKNIDIDYIQSLNAITKDYFLKYSYSPVLRFDMDILDFENNLNDRDYVLERVSSKIKEIKKHSS